MKRCDLIFACISDYGGQVRGKSFLSADAEKMLKSGIGLAPGNLMITSFGEIVDSPWGSCGDLLLIPDKETEVIIDVGRDNPAEHFMLGSLFELDGTPWACCPRGWLQRGLEALEAEFGLVLNTAFEHEFHYSGVPPRIGNAYALDAVRLQGTFLPALMYALEENGIEPEMAMPEYGPQQFEVTNKPCIGLKAADRAVRLREITRAIARAHGEKASFAPVMSAGSVGNGVHVHFSLQRSDGSPSSYAPERKYLMTEELSQFVAGILTQMPNFVAMTAASNISYERLQPNKWSASYNNLADQDREAGVRICPLSGLPGTDLQKSFNLEYRAADATANPYLVLGSLVWAGLEGLRSGLALPEATNGDPGSLSEAERKARGLRRLPSSLTEALDEMESSETIKRWMGEEFLGAYLTNKRSELKLLDGVDIDNQVKRYAECF